MTRDPTIDVLRGLAVVTMVAANMAPYSLEEPHPMPFRIIGTFAAPAFVFLAGMMVGGSRRSTDLGHASRRAALLFVVAVAIDVGCWRIAPFADFDVLYLIGLALPIASLCLAQGVRAHAVLAVSIVLATPILRARLGYGPLLPSTEPWPVWRRWLVDGWFPVFPWLGVALLGTLYTRMRTSSTPRVSMLAGGALAVVGLASLAVRLPMLVTRGGYSELFYPPTLEVLGIAIGVLLVLLACVPLVQRFVPLEWLGVYGRASLLMYVAHTALIAFVFKNLGPKRLPEFLALYAVHVVALWIIAWIRLTVSRDASTERSQSHL